MIPNKFHMNIETIKYLLLNQSTNFFMKAEESNIDISIDMLLNHY